MWNKEYIPLILSGIVVVIGLNIALTIRDAHMWDNLEQRNSQIDQLLKS